MKPSSTSRRLVAFTLIEVLIVLALLITVAMVFLPTIMRPPRINSSRIYCVNNLKQAGLAFKVWELDNGDRLPFHVPLTIGGAMEAAMAGNPAFVFEVMSNELSTPKILLCPQDQTRRAATNFLTLRSTNLKFKKRFAHVEAGARSQSRELSDLSLDEMEAFWQEAKNK